MGVPEPEAVEVDEEEFGVDVADVNLEPVDLLLALLTFFAFGSFFDVLNFRFLETVVPEMDGFDSTGGDFLMAFDFTEFLMASLLTSTGCSDSLLSSVFEFSAKFDLGLAISMVLSGVKAGGAAGLRCRLPSTTLVPFSLPSLKPLKKSKHS